MFSQILLKGSKQNFELAAKIKYLVKKNLPKCLWVYTDGVEVLFGNLKTGREKVVRIKVYHAQRNLKVYNMKESFDHLYSMFT